MLKQGFLTFKPDHENPASGRSEKTLSGPRWVSRSSRLCIIQNQPRSLPIVGAIRDLFTLILQAFRNSSIARNTGSAGSPPRALICRSREPREDPLGPERGLSVSQNMNITNSAPIYAKKQTSKSPQRKYDNLTFRYSAISPIASMEAARVNGSGNRLTL